jgi:hypothetical protein
MVEALEIGISLALGEGVSDGMAAARRDLRAIETAMTAGAVSVQRLRDAAAGALGVPQAVVAAKAGKGERPGQAAPDPGTADVARAPALPPAVQAARPASAGRALASSPSPPPPGAVPQREVRPAPPIPSPRSAGSDLAQPASRPAPAALRPAPTAPSIPRQVSAEPVAPAITILRMESQKPVGSAAHPLADGSDFAWSAAPPAGRGGPDLDWSAVQATAAAPFANAGDVASDASPGGWMQPPYVPAAAAPERVRQPAAPPGTDRERDATALPASSAPVGQGQAQARIEGDVFLDGTLVGRWMSSYLAREAGRASAGPTGFDARRNPLMPGATVGM